MHGTPPPSSTGLKKYLSFCSQANRIPIPTSEDTLLMFMAFLATQQLSLSTTKVYLSAVRNAHVATGEHVSFANHQTPRLLQVVKEIQKEHASTTSPKIRHAITINIMEDIKPFYYNTHTDTITS